MERSLGARRAPAWRSVRHAETHLGRFLQEAAPGPRGCWRRLLHVASLLPTWPWGALSLLRVRLPPGARARWTPQSLVLRPSPSPLRSPSLSRSCGLFLFVPHPRTEPREQACLEPSPRWAGRARWPRWPPPCVAAARQLCRARGRGQQDTPQLWRGRAEAHPAAWLLARW